MEGNVAGFEEAKAMEVNSNLAVDVVDSTTSASQKKEKTDSSSNRKICTMCGETRTPKWRNGPQGPKTLCNKCALNYKRKPGSLDPPPEKSNQQNQKDPSAASSKKASKSPYKALRIKATP